MLNSNEQFLKTMLNLLSWGVISIHRHFSKVFPRKHKIFILVEQKLLYGNNNICFKIIDINILTNLLRASLIVVPFD